MKVRELISKMPDGQDVAIVDSITILESEISTFLTADYMECEVVSVRSKRNELTNLTYIEIEIKE